MIDGVKILDLAVSVDNLLENDQLLFPLEIEERTGVILNRPRWATKKGLTFKLIPRLKVGIRCELSGSLHRYHNDGVHNANDFTVGSLLKTICNLVECYGIEPFKTSLNNVEFGVNVHLPFPVTDLLSRLICYRGVPFTKDIANGGIYYQATLRQYAVKLYDKGRQYNLAGNILRVEIKVLRMQYLKVKGIELNTVGDLLDTDTYSQLGKLLVDTFQRILFDDPTISLDKLTTRKRECLLQGRNPRNWEPVSRETFDNDKNYDRHRKNVQRQEKRFRELLDVNRQGNDWQTEVTRLIRMKWNELTRTSTALQTTIDCQLRSWKEGTSVKKCPNITDPENGKMSQYYPLSLV